MPRATSKHIKCYVSPTQKAIITDNASFYNLTPSKYIKLVALDKPLPKADQDKTIIALSKINADLARLSNMQRMNRDNRPNINQKLIDSIRTTQGAIKDKLRALKYHHDY